MNKKMNLDEYQRVMDVAVVKSTLTIIDRRTGQIGTKEFYRFGYRFPYESVGKTLSEYGYDLIGHADDEVREGTLDFELLFASLATEKVEAS